MNINIDFLVSGCNTRCKHCYVNGGPGPLMDIDDALTCIEKLDAVAQFLPTGTSFTLDHEPMNHPHLDKILNAAAHTKYINNYHHGMTTGIGLMARRDKDAVVQSYLENGYQIFGTTIHGIGRHHDEIVGRAGAYEKALASVKYLQEKGARVEVVLMFNRFFPSDAEELSVMLEQLRPHYIGFAVPIFTPHANMQAFEPYRGDIDALTAVANYLPQWNGEEIGKQADQYTIAATVTALKQGMNLRQKFQEQQDEVYLTLHPDGKLYVGNTGMETALLCDLRFADTSELAERINRLSPNRDYSAFYDLDVLPTEEELISALETLPQGYVYGDKESILYRGLSALHIPTKILEPPLTRRTQPNVG